MPTRHLTPLSDQDKERAWKYIDQTEGFGPNGDCWPWTKATNKDGYGIITIKQKATLIHRVVYFLVHEIDPKELKVLHHCDNPPCCNPSHLFKGTQADNLRDMMQKGRMATGDRSGSHLHPERRARGDRHGSKTHPESRPHGMECYNTKLTDMAVREIRTSTESLTVVAKRFGISWSYAGEIRRGKKRQSVIS